MGEARRRPTALGLLAVVGLGGLALGAFRCGGSAVVPAAGELALEISGCRTLTAPDLCVPPADRIVRLLVMPPSDGTLKVSCDIGTPTVRDLPAIEGRLIAMEIPPGARLLRIEMQRGGRTLRQVVALARGHPLLQQAGERP